MVAVAAGRDHVCKLQLKHSPIAVAAVSDAVKSLGPLHTSAKTAVAAARDGAWSDDRTWPSAAANMLRPEPTPGQPSRALIGEEAAEAVPVADKGLELGARCTKPTCTCQGVCATTRTLHGLTLACRRDAKNERLTCAHSAEGRACANGLPIPSGPSGSNR